MRDPQERLAAIRDRADARIAAIRKRNRMITGACTTLALCVAIGLGIYNAMSLPPTPTLEPTIGTTASSGATTATSTTAVSTTAVTTTVPSTDTTVIATQPSASEPVHVTVTTEPPVLSTVTTVMTTLPSRPTVSHIATTTRTAPTVTVSPPSTTSVSKDTTTWADPTTTTWPEVMATQPTTTTREYDGDMETQPPLPTTTTTTPCTDGSFNVNIQSPSYSETTTTTAAPWGAVIYSVSSVRDVSVGDIITVDVLVSENHYMIEGQIDIGFDPNALALQGLQGVNTDILPYDCFQSFSTPTAGSAQFLFSGLTSVGSAQGGTIFTLSFEVLEGIGDGTVISCNIPMMCSGNGEIYDTTVATVNGTVTPATSPTYDWWI